MVRQKGFIKYVVVLMLVMAAACSAGDTKQQVSGSLINGFRVLEIHSSDTEWSFTVFRGDYIKFKVDGSMTGSTVAFTDSDQSYPLLSDIMTAPVVKMKTLGAFEFSIADKKGLIRVIEYQQGNYQAVTAQQGFDLIQQRQPFILDVRTPQEFKAAHLEDAVLIPVQVLQQRINELSSKKDEPILVYCATGNRSTVASKILIDKGFKRIYNLRNGIKDWYKKKYPVVR